MSERETLKKEIKDEMRNEERRRLEKRIINESIGEINSVTNGIAFLGTILLVALVASLFIR